MLVIGRSVQFK